VVAYHCWLKVGFGRDEKEEALNMYSTREIGPERDNGQVGWKQIHLMQL
jgi:hypothetical protein